LDHLLARHESLAHAVELIAPEMLDSNRKNAEAQAKNAEAQAKTQAMLDSSAESIQSLAPIALAHEARISDLERQQ
jgi:hypothetical protein